MQYGHLSKESKTVRIFFYLHQKNARMRTLVWSMLLHSAIAMQKTCDSNQRVNEKTFAVLTQDGGIEAWGLSTHGGEGEPTGTDFTSIVSTHQNFAALKVDGSIEAWGLTDYNAHLAPSGTGFTSITSNAHAFAALKEDGGIATWGNTNGGGSGGPTDLGYTTIYSTANSAFAALKEDGSITAWGSSGGSGAPSGTGFVSIASNLHSFAALKTDGSIEAWGSTDGGGSGAPTDTGYTAIFSGPNVYAALKTDGSISAWGSAFYGGSNAPTGSGYVHIVSNNDGFAAIHSDGSLVSWGNGAAMSQYPTGTGHTALAAIWTTFAALTEDGGVVAWGTDGTGGTVSNAPTGTGYTKIYSNVYAFAVLDASGGITAWGHSTFGGSGAPTSTGFTDIFSNNVAFLGRKSDGSIEQWGGGNIVGASAGTPPPTGTGYSFSSSSYSCNNYNPTSGTAVQDIHLRYPNGGRADFRGLPLTYYNLISAPRLSINVVVKETSFHLKQALIHGTFITEAHTALQTSAGPLQLSVWADRLNELNYAWNISDGTCNRTRFVLGPHAARSCGEVDFRVDYSSLHLSTSETELKIAARPVYNRVAGAHHRLDVGLALKKRPDKIHGLLGQGYIGRTRNGKTDTYPSSGEFRTAAWGEGAIDGVPTDYEMPSKYATDFRFSCFHSSFNLSSRVYTDGESS